MFRECVRVRNCKVLSRFNECNGREDSGKHRCQQMAVCRQGLIVGDVCHRAAATAFLQMLTVVVVGFVVVMMAIAVVLMAVMVRVNLVAVGHAEVEFQAAVSTGIAAE